MTALPPTIDILKSGTRKEDLLMEKDALTRVFLLRKLLTHTSGFTYRLWDAEAIKYGIAVDKVPAPLGAFLGRACSSTILLRRSPAGGCSPATSGRAARSTALSTARGTTTATAPTA